jgi:hypothetical protein
VFFTTTVAARIVASCLSRANNTTRPDARKKVTRTAKQIVLSAGLPALLRQVFLERLKILTGKFVNAGLVRPVGELGPKPFPASRTALRVAVLTVFIGDELRYSFGNGFTCAESRDCG